MAIFASNKNILKMKTIIKTKTTLTIVLLTMTICSCSNSSSYFDFSLSTEDYYTPIIHSHSVVVDDTPWNLLLEKMESKDTGTHTHFHF